MLATTGAAALVAGFMVMGTAGAAQANNGNNGTVKIEGADAESLPPDNNPHQGCTFTVEWYNFETDPAGGTIEANVDFALQAPTADEEHSLSVTSGDTTPAIEGDDVDGVDPDGVYQYTLAFTGAPHTAGKDTSKQGYHVKVTVSTPLTKGKSDVKSKVFWVAGCDAPPTAVAPVPYEKTDPTCETDGALVPTTQPTGVTASQEPEGTGPGTYVITFTADPGYELSGPSTQTITVLGRTGPPCDVAAVAPTVRQSEQCEQEGSYTIPATSGVQYLLDGEPVAAGTYTGPVEGTITAEASGSLPLSNPGFSFALDVDPAEECPDEVLPTEAEDVCPNIPGAQGSVPDGLVLEDDRCVAPTDEPTDEVLGTATAVPTAVDAGLGGPLPTSLSTADLVGRSLVGGGLVLLMMAALMQAGRLEHGAHQA